MTAHTIASLPRLSSTGLSEILLSHTSSNLDAPSTAPEKIAIIDVRDDGQLPLLFYFSQTYANEEPFPS
jgi:hypothetical protein